MQEARETSMLNNVAGAVLAFVGLLGMGASGAAGDAGRQARDILVATGVKGGLVVHVGCGDGKLTAALRAGESYLVHGLDADARNVEAARKHIQSLGLYGPVSADRFDGRRLPYADNLVNLVVAEALGSVPMAEVMRVLAPGGVAYVGGQGTVKPWPPEIDEWTHYLHDASNNAVARDSLVGPPRHYQWLAGPAWSRHHDHMASTSAMVSAGGRIFYIFDEGSTASIMLPARWALVARDAFNGVLLWRRPIAEWHTHLWPLKSGPAQLPRRLVAAGGRVYATLGIRAPLSALDAATGETLRTYEGTEDTEEVLLRDGVLFLLVNEAAKPGQAHASVAEVRADASKRVWDEAPRAVLAVEAATGKRLWRRPARVVPLSLAADGERVCYHDGEKLVALDRRDGRELWASPPVTRLKAIPVHFAPTLVLYEDVVLFAGGENYTPHQGARDKLTAVSARNGRILWSAEHPRSGYQSPEDVLVIGGLVWSGDMTTPRCTGVVTGRDPRTGEVKAQFPADDWPHMPHHRCHRAKGTERYYIAGRTGIEFVDVAAKHWIAHHWVRGACLYGLMPCNGLIYTPPHDCACYIESKLNGFNALAAARRSQVSGAGGERLEKGPAYSEIGNRESEIANASDWPTYRGDAARSSSARAAVPSELRMAWEARVGGRLAQPAVAEGRLFVPVVDTHAVHALDAATGRPLWAFTAGGRVDSPPTIWQGRVLFGSADGWVYCLRAADGQLVWRFRAAPGDSRIAADGQLESPWPVHGSVLVHNDSLYCVAGRSMFLDGGLRLVRLDPRTGACLGETVLDERHPDTGKNLQEGLKWPYLPVALPDILSCDGRNIYMRSLAFDLEGKRRYVKAFHVSEQEGDDVHLFSPTGFLDDAWWHRSYWVWGRAFGAGYYDFTVAGRLVPAGRILAVGDKTVYGYGRRWQYFAHTTPMEYHLFAAAKGAKVVDPARPDGQPAPKPAKGPSRPPLTRFVCEWSKAAPAVVRAMVLAGSTLFVAGPPDVLDEEEGSRSLGEAVTQSRLAEQAAAMDGARGALLLAVSAADGRRLAAWRLAATPVFDGMATASGRLFISTTDGKVLCLAGEGQPLDAAAEAELVDTPAHRPAAPAGPPAKVAETKSHPDFQHVARVQIAPCDLGYRLQAPSGAVGFALRKLPVPLARHATFRLKVRMLPNDATALPPANAFIVFGDGTEDEKLIKCGLRSKAKAASIVQGPLLTGKTASGAIEPKVNQELELAATVDLTAGRVTLTVLGQTVTANLDRPLKSIAYVGYCVHSVASEFSPLVTEGK